MKKSTAKSKLSVSLDSPYAATKWPELSHTDHDVILDLLCTLLEPIGRHREQNAIPSKGKRSKKRKRKESQASGAPSGTPKTPTEAPGIKSHITIGFNSTTRHLESLSSNSLPPTMPTHLKIQKDTDTKPEGDGSQAPKSHTHLAAVFVPKSTQRDIIHAHLPLLLRTASMAAPESPPTRLVPLSKSSEGRLAIALGIPRVGLVGLMEDAPGARALIEVVRDTIMPVEIPWLEQARAAEYLTPKYVVYDPSRKAA